MLEPILRKLQNWRMRSITRRKLALLDDRLLADIGAERNAIGDFIARRTGAGDAR